MKNQKEKREKRKFLWRKLGETDERTTEAKMKKGQNSRTMEPES